MTPLPEENYFEIIEDRKQQYIDGLITYGECLSSIINESIVEIKETRVKIADKIAYYKDIISDNQGELDYLDSILK